jgi:hypothetical protein
VGDGFKPCSGLDPLLQRLGMLIGLGDYQAETEDQCDNDHFLIMVTEQADVRKMRIKMVGAGVLHLLMSSSASSWARPTRWG